VKAIIVAVDQGNGIGKGNDIPWKYSEDMKFFAATTKNSTCIMGRKTYESILPYLGNKTSLLPHRQCLVLTRKDDYEVKGATIIRSLPEGLHEASYDNVFFIGGESIYRDALKYIDTAFVTYIPGDYDCDVNIKDVIDHIGRDFMQESRVTSDAKLMYIKYVDNTK
jgi:dihydrofolate reductase